MVHYFGESISMVTENSLKKIQTTFLILQENILQKVVMTAFADRTVVTIAVSTDDGVVFLLPDFCSKPQFASTFD